MSQSWRHYLQLSKKKYRREARQCLVEGVRVCEEALLANWEIEAVFVTPAFTGSDHWRNFSDTLEYRKIQWRELPDASFNRLSDTDTPQGILMVLNIPPENFREPKWQKKSFVLALEGIRDPGNVGTLMRTADWYGVDTLLLSADCADPYNPKVLRGSMGSIFQLRVYIADDFIATLNQLKENHFWVVGAAPNGQKVLQSTHFKKPVALVVGSEANGLSGPARHAANLTVKIWRYGQAESLNVGVAGGVCLHHIAGQIFSTRPTTDKA